jgi:hypothetical protein
MTDTPTPDEPVESFDGPISPASEETLDLRTSLDCFNVALKALRMVTDAGVAAADNVAPTATAEEIHQSWLASLMPLRYTVYNLQFRGSDLIQSIGDMLEKD